MELPIQAHWRTTDFAATGIRSDSLENHCHSSFGLSNANRDQALQGKREEIQEAGDLRCSGARLG